MIDAAEFYNIPVSGSFRSWGNKDGVLVGKVGVHLLLFCLLFDLQKLIEEESVNLLSNPVLQLAMIVITNLR